MLILAGTSHVLPLAFWSFCREHMLWCTFFCLKLDKVLSTVELHIEMIIVVIDPACVLTLLLMSVSDV